MKLGAFYIKRHPIGQDRTTLILNRGALTQNLPGSGVIRSARHPNQATLHPNRPSHT